MPIDQMQIDAAETDLHDALQRCWVVVKEAVLFEPLPIDCDKTLWRDCAKPGVGGCQWGR